MALGESGAVYTWGYGGYGALGIGSLLDKNTPQTVALPAPATKISNNGYHMMALLSTGDLYAWGKNDMGEVGIGGAAHKHAPQHIAVPLDAGDAIASINAGYEHSAVLTEAGKLYAWGSMGDGRLGDGSKTGYQRTPKYIRDGVASIEGCGAYRHQFVIDGSGAAWGAGIDTHGQLGNDRDLGLTGRQTDELGFVPVEFFAENGGVRW
jgi:alpha-tubulin suppressor-like RCC1 family protein